ncbi:MAG: carboxyl transferase domain-containing protein [Myxococcota bacterium]
MSERPMGLRRCLIANRGEIAIRIAQGCAEVGVEAVGVAAADEHQAPHSSGIDTIMTLPGRGAAAYLDVEAILGAAEAAGCDAVHPGYGFLAESAAFAEACADRGLCFVGPLPATLALYGDKDRARRFAEDAGVSVVPGTRAGADRAQIEALWDTLPSGAALMLKATDGGGGRGLRLVTERSALPAALERCRAEVSVGAGATASVFAEQWVGGARHIEVQIVGDGQRVTHLGERECSVQRRHQKIIEWSPAWDLPSALRDRVIATAFTLARAAPVRSLLTLEFLVDPSQQAVFFLEGNPRLQVEHTVTEEVTGLDLVGLQLRLAGGATLAELGLLGPPARRGAAVQARLCLETMDADGRIAAGRGRVTAYQPPRGPGLRVDDALAVGQAADPRFDSLVAKLVAHVRHGTVGDALAKLGRALASMQLTGVESNRALLRAIVQHPELRPSGVSTTFVDEHRATLWASAQRFAASEPESVESVESVESLDEEGREGPGTSVVAPLRATVVSVEVSPGDEVVAGQALVVLGAMKMEHVVEAPASGVVLAIDRAPGEIVAKGATLLRLTQAASEDAEDPSIAEADPDRIRPDLQALRARQALLEDVARPEAVARRRRLGMRTARENLDDLFDPGTFVEYGALAVAAQRARRSESDLQQATPADGLVTGHGLINAAQVGLDAARCVGLAYDYTVLAGTQGFFNHLKTDRILTQAERHRLPVVWYVEGGGGRPGDVDVEGSVTVSGLCTPSFELYARLSGLVPRIGIAAGRCFAGNAVFFGCSDVTIATRGASIGLGGPAMIEGGGLGVVTPEQVGPAEVLAQKGVVDVLVDDEAEATVVARRILGMFQGRAADWVASDQRSLRALVPERRRRAFDVRRAVDTIADEGSVIELRRDYGPGMLTAFVRIEGWPLGLLANVDRPLGGAIDADGADKASRFMQLCDAFDLPIVSLCDTPGFMVGPDSERTAAVRRGSRMFVTAASLTVPIFTVILRRAYGLGAMAMAGGQPHSAAMTVAWPTGELGAMGFEGAVRLGFRKELQAQTDPAAREALFGRLLGQMIERGQATSAAAFLEVDAVIDPADTRAVLVKARRMAGSAPARQGKKRPFVDTW